MIVKKIVNEGSKPSKVGKYECICALTLWEWLTQNIDNEIKGFPLPTSEPFANVLGDERLVDRKGLEKWLNLDVLDMYLEPNGRIDEFIALLFSRLAMNHRDEFRKNYTLLFNQDIQDIRSLQEANTYP